MVPAVTLMVMLANCPRLTAPLFMLTWPPTPGHTWKVLPPTACTRQAFAVRQLSFILSGVGVAESVMEGVGVSERVLVVLGVRLGVML